MDSLPHPDSDSDQEFQWHDAGPPDHHHPYAGMIDGALDHLPQPSWTHRTPQPDPIGDLREFGAAVFLDRPLTLFEKIVIRSGLAKISLDGRLVLDEPE